VRKHEALQVEAVGQDAASIELCLEERRAATGHSGEHRLYRSLLMSALTDARQPENSRKREAARRWFDDYSGTELRPALSCEAVCTALEIGERELAVTLSAEVPS
jgi:hypothetical protein